MIPKNIHQIWIGEKLEPHYLMDTWKMEGWGYALWDDKKIESLNLFNKDIYNYYYQKGNFAGASNIARIEILLRYGGVYIDADTERVKKFPEELLNNKMFAAEGNKVPNVKYRVANGVMGAVKGSKIMQEYIYRISLSTEFEPSWDTTGGTMLTSIMKDMPEECTILPAYLFYPMSSIGTTNPDAKKAIAKHLWGSKGNVY